MKSISATKFHRKSGVAKWRDLQFSGPLVEMLFDRNVLGGPPVSFQKPRGLRKDFSLHNPQLATRAASTQIADPYYRTT
jgi:hypothetical protein